MKKKSIIIISIVVLIIIIGIVVFILLNTGLSRVEKEALVNVESLYTTMESSFYNKQNLQKILAEVSGDDYETKESDFRIIEIRKVDEKKLKNKYGQVINKSEIKNEYAGFYVDENGDFRNKEDTTDYTKYNFFAIKYIFEGKMQIAIYIGGYEYNSSVMEDLGIGSWVREAWDMDIYTKDKFDVNKIMKKIVQK